MNNLIFVAFSIIGLLSYVNGQKVDISWDKIERISKTTPTLQVVVNPLIRPNSPIHNRVFTELKNLGADYVRFVPWLPYPKLAVAELEPPTTNSTSWNFTLIDPMMIDFMNAQKGKKVIINFSTIPAWIFKTPKRISYPDDPNQVDWNYTQGTELVDRSFKQLADYYARLVSWYVSGGFTDEVGKRHESGHHFNIDYWEVLNEVEAEHHTTPQQYTERYDAIVNAIQKVSPKTKFVGMALEAPRSDINTWFPYFLNHSNHKPGTPINMISYHFYAIGKANETIDSMQVSFFQQADTFLSVVPSIEKIRKLHSPDTQTTINEIGSISDQSMPKYYWNLSGALFAYIFSHLSSIGIEFAGESQLVGYPTQFPSVSMVHWENGAPNARFRVLQLLINNCGPGDKLVNTSVTGTSNIHAHGFITKTGEKKLLLINKRSGSIQVQLSEIAKETHFIDIDTNDLIENKKLNTNNITLHGFAVHVVIF